MQLAIAIPPDRLNGLLQELSQFPGEANRAMSDAINATAREGRKLIIQSYFKGTTLEQKTILQRISQGKRATPSKLETTIRIKAKPIALNQFAFQYDRESKSGVVIKLTRSQTLDLPQAFMGIGPRGKPHVLTRSGGMVKQTQAHYVPNIGRTRQTVATQKGKNLIQLTELDPELLVQPLQQTEEVLMRKSADAMDKVLSRGGKGISDRALRAIQKEFA
jgi:hypothetical protein